MIGMRLQYLMDPCEKYPISDGKVYVEGCSDQRHTMHHSNRRARYSVTDRELTIDVVMAE